MLSKRLLQAFYIKSLLVNNEVYCTLRQASVLTDSFDFEILIECYKYNTTVSTEI